MFWHLLLQKVALRKESVDRNTASARPSPAANLSLSARRAWIEIGSGGILQTGIAAVALRKESVDRNASTCFWRLCLWVALRKESVDRNRAYITTITICIVVALRKESVDRNYYSDKDADWVRVSLSARRAWIEISWYWHFEFFCPVALRKESVDRNCDDVSD